MISEEFRKQVLNVLSEITFNVKASTDDHEDLMLIGLIFQLSNRLRELSLERKYQ